MIFNPSGDIDWVDCALHAGAAFIITFVLALGGLWFAITTFILLSYFGYVREANQREAKKQLVYPDTMKYWLWGRGARWEMYAWPVGSLLGFIGIVFA